MLFKKTGQKIRKKNQKNRKIRKVRRIRRKRKEVHKNRWIELVRTCLVSKIPSKNKKLR